MQIMHLAALEEVPLSAPHLQLAIDIVEFTERRRDSPSGSFRGVILKFRWQEQTAVVAAIDARR